MHTSNVSIPLLQYCISNLSPCEIAALSVGHTRPHGELHQDVCLENLKSAASAAGLLLSLLGLSFENTLHDLLLLDQEGADDPAQYTVVSVHSQPCWIMQRLLISEIPLMQQRLPDTISMENDDLPLLDDAMAEMSAVDAADVLVPLGNVRECVWPSGGDLRVETRQGLKRGLRAVRSGAAACEVMLMACGEGTH